MAQLDWAIIGSGPQGEILARALLAYGVPANRLAMFDPKGRGLSEFIGVARNSEMVWMRSLAEHHLERDPHSLRRYAERVGREDEISQWGKPTYRLWQTYALKVLPNSQIFCVRSKVLEIVKDGLGFRLLTDAGVFNARAVILATGLERNPFWPEWCRELRARDASCIAHVFEGNLPWQALTNKRIAIIGGGVSACQVAHRLAQLRKRELPIYQISLFPIKVTQFDCGAAWLEQSKRAELIGEHCYEERERVVHNAREVGTISHEVALDLDEDIRSRELEYIEGEVLTADHNGEICLTLKGGRQFSVDYLVVATALQSKRDPSALSQQTAGRLQLPTTALGSPIVDNKLQWLYPGLHVSGELGKLVLGPFAGSIVSAHWAAQHILG